jgi:transposase
MDGKPYSEDMRLAVVRSIEAGYTREEAAELHGVSLSSVGRFIKLWRSSGTVCGAKFGGYKGYTLEPHAERLKRWVAHYPDITLGELQRRLSREKVRVSISAIFRFLRHVKLTLKKSPARGRTGSARRRQRPPGVAAKAATV